MTRSGATSQTYPTPGHKANPQFSLRTTSRNQPHPKPAHHKGGPFPGRSTRGLAAIFPHQRRRLRKQYTPPNTHRKSTLGRFRQPKFGVIAGIHGHNLPMRDVVGRKALLWSGSHCTSSVSVRARAARAAKRHVAWGPWTVPRMGHQRLVPGITDHCLDLK